MKIMDRLNKSKHFIDFIYEQETNNLTFLGHFINN